MSLKINLIMLIDDDNLQNLINQKIISRLECARKTQVFQYADEALAYFEKHIQNPEAQPELIMLDINMPQKNGWEFLQDFRQIARDLAKPPIIFMLTSSLHPDDLAKAKSFQEIKEFVNKPLVQEDFKALVNKYF